MDAFSSDDSFFGWGVLINVVPTTAGGDLKSILAKFTVAKLEHVKKQACITWGDTTTDFNDDVAATLIIVTINTEGE